MKRRDFLKGVAAAGGAAALGLPGKSAAAGKASVKAYKEIGKTGLKMSDISFGCGKLSSASLIARAMDRGINYFDTAPDYGKSEKVLGQAIKKLKKRDKMIIASKFCNPPSYPAHLKAGSPKKEYISVVEGSLSRLNTDYLDFCFVHALGEMGDTVEDEKKRLLDENLLSAVDQLKKEGKIKYLAASSHGPVNMEALLMAAVKSGHYDMIMPAFNFMKFPKLPDVIREAKKRGVGVVAMKTLAGAKESDFDSKGQSFAPAALKWVLSHSEVDGLVVTIKSVGDMGEYLQASGKNLTKADAEVLKKYEAKYSSSYCRTGCGECVGSCPSGAGIATILRYQMYFENYGMEKRAMEGYAKLDGNAECCVSCEDDACEKACPYGLPVASMLRRAHEDLSLKV
ncbi:MAG: aldo/keto reductase [Deltaproteobacteria bacterium]|nr:aldo/keto reductase [Deltaproteobacteria bacterium]